MIENIFLLLTILAYAILVTSLIYRKAKGTRMTLALISAIIFSILAVSSFGIIPNECKDYNIDCTTGVMQCQDQPIINEGLGILNGGMAIFSFIMFVIFIFNQSDHYGKEEWA